MKKQLITAFCIAASLLAGTAQAQWRMNFLVGGSIGYAEREGDFNYSIHDNARNASIGGIGDLNDSGLLGGFLAGAQMYCNKWLFGVEANVDWYAEDNTDQFYLNRLFQQPPALVSAHYEQDAVVGLTGRIGYQLACRLLPYIRLGAETSRDHLQSSILIPQGPFTTYEGSHRSYRFVGGIGVEVPFGCVPNTTLRAEYNYHAKEKSLEASGTLTDGIEFVAFNSDTARRTHSGRFSLVYNFI